MISMFYFLVATELFTFSSYSIVVLCLTQYSVNWPLFTWRTNQLLNNVQYSVPNELTNHRIATFFVVIDQVVSILKNMIMEIGGGCDLKGAHASSNFPQGAAQVAIDTKASLVLHLQISILYSVENWAWSICKWQYMNNNRGKCNTSRVEEISKSQTLYCAQSWLSCKFYRQLSVCLQNIQIRPTLRRIRSNTANTL